MGEDFCFIVDCLSASPRIAVTQEPVYRVRREGDSNTQRYMPSLQHDVDYLNEHLFKACKGDLILEGVCRESVVNAAWDVCANTYKPGSGLTAQEKHSVVANAMDQYCDAINGLDFAKAGFPKAKLLLLKVGVHVPIVVSLAFAAKEALKRAKRSYLKAARGIG